MRASSLGKSTDEMAEYLRRKEGEGDHFSGGAAAEMGTKMHRVLQERWRRLGLLEGDEIEVFDPKLNVTGHIDAILRIPDGRGNYQRTIVDIKTKTAEKFNAMLPPEGGGRIACTQGRQFPAFPARSSDFVAETPESRLESSIIYAFCTGIRAGTAWEPNDYRGLGRGTEVWLGKSLRGTPGPADGAC